MSATKLKQIKFYLEPELYERLANIAKEQSTTVPRLVKGLVLEALGETENVNLAERVKKLEAKVERMGKEMGRMEWDIAMLQKALTLSTAEAGRFLLLKCSQVGCSSPF